MADVSVRFRWPWVTLKGGTRRVIFFHADLRAFSGCTVWPRTTNFGRIIHVWRGEFYRGHLRPLRKGRGPSAIQFWGFTSIYAHTLWRRTTKFDVVTHVEWGLYLWDSNASHPKRAGVSALTNFGVLLYLCLGLHPLTQNDQIRHGNTWGVRVISHPRHGHCIARFVSDSWVSCTSRFVNSFASQRRSAVWFWAQYTLFFWILMPFLLLNQQLILWSLHVSCVYAAA